MEMAHMVCERKKVYHLSYFVIARKKKNIIPNTEITSTHSRIAY